MKTLLAAIAILLSANLAAQDATLSSLLSDVELDLCAGVTGYADSIQRGNSLTEVAVKNDLPYSLDLVYLDQSGWQQETVIEDRDMQIVTPDKAPILLVDSNIGLCMGVFVVDKARTSETVSAGFDFVSFTPPDDTIKLSKTAPSRPPKNTPPPLYCPAGIAYFDIGSGARNKIDPVMVEPCLKALPQGTEIDLTILDPLLRKNLNSIKTFQLFANSATDCGLMEEALSDEIINGLKESFVAAGALVYLSSTSRKSGDSHWEVGGVGYFENYLEHTVWLANNYPALVTLFTPIPKLEAWTGECMCDKIKPVLGGNC